MTHITRGRRKRHRTRLRRGEPFRDCESLGRRTPLRPRQPAPNQPTPRTTPGTRSRARRARPTLGQPRPVQPRATRRRHALGVRHDTGMRGRDRARRRRDAHAAQQRHGDSRCYRDQHARSSDHASARTSHPCLPCGAVTGPAEHSQRSSLQTGSRDHKLRSFADTNLNKPTRARPRSHDLTRHDLTRDGASPGSLSTRLRFSITHPTMRSMSTELSSPSGSVQTPSAEAARPSSHSEAATAPGRAQ